MAQIFISYSHRDVSHASRIAAELESRGWSVWWDPDIRTGESFIVLVNREISQASCVVVLWSKSSVDSHWVMEEAHHALMRDIICPVMVEPDSQLPVGFATVKYVPLWEWRDGQPVGGFGPLIDELERIVGKSPSPAPVDATSASQSDEETVPRGGSFQEAQTAAREPKFEAAQSLKALAERRRYFDFSDFHWMDLPVLGLLALSLVFLLTNILLRFGFNTFVLTLDDLTLVLLGLAAIFGAAMAERNRRSIRSPAAILLFRGALRRHLTALHAVVSALVFGAVTYGVAMSAIRSFRVQETTFVGIPIGPIGLAAAIAFLLMTVFSLMAIPRTFRRRSVT